MLSYFCRARAFPPDLTNDLAGTTYAATSYGGGRPTQSPLKRLPCRTAAPLAVCLLGIAAFGSAQAAVREAASASRADVDAAYAACSEGDTLAIPSGAATWTSGLTISKAITLQGAGVGRTIITDGIVGSRAGDQSIISWNTAAGKSYRMTGLEFAPGRSDIYYGGSVTFYGDATKVRVDNCRWNDVNNKALGIYGSVVGVCDHCSFDMSSNKVCIQVEQASLFGDTLGFADGSWENPVDWGGPGAWYVEDCSFTGAMTANDGARGGRSVYRFCTFQDTRLDNHGTESTQRYRGGRSMEVYNNTFATARNITIAVYLRSGTGVFFNNTVTGNYRNFVDLVNYRNADAFLPWGSADGTMAWDGNNLTDGAATPGGAGDGVFEAGTATGGAPQVLSDSGKSWTSNQWTGYTLRTKRTFTAAGSSASGVAVAGAGWTPNQWAGYIITKSSTNEKSYVDSNSVDTLALSSSFYRTGFNTGDVVVLSRGCEIASNTASQITTKNQIYAPWIYGPGDEYEIRKVDWSLDQPGRGLTTDIIGDGAGASYGNPKHQNLNQSLDPIYEWNNSFNGANASVVTEYATIVEGREFFNDSPKPGYAPYRYPHPLVSGVANDAPTLTNLADRFLSMGGTTAAMDFTVGDSETAVGSLIVTGTSSNPSLVPSTNIVFGGSGASRTVTVTAAPSQSGTATISITVSDGTLSASDTFLVMVSAGSAPKPPKGFRLTPAP